MFFGSLEDFNEKIQHLPDGQKIERIAAQCLTEAALQYSQHQKQKRLKDQNDFLKYKNSFKN